MIEVNGVTKIYGENTAVDNISFSIKKGHIYGFLGPNGAGKTTTLNMITGNLAPSAGEITVCGHDISSEPVSAKKCIGYLPEIPPLYTDLTPYEYLKFVAEAKGVKKSAVSNAVYSVLNKTGTYNVKDRLIRSLSKGYRQRVGIAQAIIGDPEIIIFDEPTVGLDPKQVVDVRKLIKSLSKNRTVIISSHILSEIEEICDSIIIINSGRIAACDTLSELQSKYTMNDVLKLTVKCKKARAEEVLSALKAVPEHTVKEIFGGAEITINMPKNRDMRESLFFSFAKAGVPILEMHRKTVTLEDVFLKVTDETNEPEEDLEDKPQISETISAPLSEKTPERNNSGDDEDENDDEDYRPLFKQEKK